ncbi:MAG: BlaI/MecI/CopY family transcriptional regulator [Oscillospiraceae bacterium]|nr:BlaI/MecI/CopY family transcriptional regulator [Oscillospiraceae bacterium]
MKPDFKLTNAETRLAELVWLNEPVASMELVRLAKDEFGWSKSTTFTHLKMLIKKHVTKNDNSCVTMLFTREEITAQRSCMYVDEAFGGSLPMLVASFTSSRKLTPEQIAELKQLIDEYEGSPNHG